MSNSNNKPILIIMCGLSGSGKSAIATQLAQQYKAKIVASDEIRKEIPFREDQSQNEQVFRVFHNRIKRYLENGTNVIADATNVTFKSRRSILNKILKIDCYKICYIIPKRLEDCIRDNKFEKHAVPEYVIDKQVRHFQIPFMEEGFDEIIVHDFHYETYPITDYIDKMRGYDQKNPHHKYTLDEHSKNVDKKFKEICGNELYEKYSLGSIYHDIGKPFCQTIDDDGIAHYLRHAEYGTYILLTNFMSSTIDDCFLVNYHMYPYHWTEEKTHDVS